ncbi:MAG: DUF4276 family protein [Cyanobacteria bacterium J06623_4]
MYQSTQFSRHGPDLSRFPKPPKTLEERVSASLKYYPCDVLFIHRDADNQGWAHRENEINEALDRANLTEEIPVICVIPVRMTEAWLFSDESAIRIAADNPQGRQKLDLPSLKDIESIANPKDRLHTTLRQAGEVSGRRLKKFNRRLSNRVQRISEITHDFSLLRELAAFKALELSIQALVKTDFF